ncbi:MDR family MFS transporter [Fictibacillus iocasae]|uniref:MDR family MFS transporter n=1 Tax=Fictibacillus iocasae TaxID=2715437 RepID=A0ABW2NV30_9BACL
MRFKDFHRTIQIRLAENFISTTVSTMVFPFMAIYFAGHFGAKITGIIMIVNIVIGMIAGLYGGYFADKIGRKKMIQLSGALRIGAYALMAAANSPWLESPVVTFLMMTVNSVCWGIGGPASRAMLIDLSTPENRKYVYAISYWLTNLSITAGSIAGAFLIKSHRFELFAALAVSAVISWLLVHYYIDETYVPKKSSTKEKPQVLREMAFNYSIVLKDRMFVKYMVAVILIMSLEVQLTNYVGIRLEKEMEVHTLTLFSTVLNIDGVRMMGFLQTENTILVVTATALVAVLFKKFKEYNILMVGLVIYTIGYSIIGFSNSPLLLVFAMLLATLGEITYAPVSESKLAEIADDEHRSAYMAVSGMKWNMGMVIASICVSIGSLFPGWAMSLLFFTMGMCSIYLMHTVFQRQTKQTDSLLQAAVNR